MAGGKGWPVVITPAEMKSWSSHQLSQMNRWAKANKLNPTDISVSHPLSIEYIDSQDVIRYYRINRDESGGVLHDKDTGLVSATVQLVPLVVPLP